jgi:hypothetical protein
MQLQRVERVNGSLPDRVRVQASVRYEGDGQEELLWFDLPSSAADQASTSGNPWLVALLPLAVSLGEPLRLAVPVDPLLLENCRSLMGVWHAWYPERAPVPIEAQIAPSERGTAPRGVGLCFSGGVDSFTSLIKHNGPATTAPFRVTDLLLVHGADIPLSDSEAFARLLPRMADVAREFGVVIIDVATNLRVTRWASADWGHLAHAALFAAAGHVLEPRLSRLLIASSARYDRLMPWGSHPLTDPLYSSFGFGILHDGADTERTEKTMAIASHPAVHRHLRVCWIGRTDTNCGRCPKCFNTMLGLELAGSLDKSETLPRSIEPAAFESLYLERDGTYAAYWMVLLYREQAVAMRRADLVALIDRIIARSDRLRFLRRGLDGLARRKLIPGALRDRLIGRLFNRTVKY